MACSVLKSTDQPRGGETTSYCSLCKLKTLSWHGLASRVLLRNMVKHVSNEEAASCFEIWHSHWKNGSFIPAVRGKRKTRARKPRSRAGSSEDDADARSDELLSGDSDDDGFAPQSLRP
ncbi:hypothetical protein PI124_g20340 [Phytophthora idaei]|nr:hypothetical protein PI124_g20340 [Phytophthora idaei]